LTVSFFVADVKNNRWVWIFYLNATNNKV